MTIFRYSFLVLALTGCGQSADENQNIALRKIEERLASLESAQEADLQEKDFSDPSPAAPESGPELVKRLGDEKDARERDFLREQELRNLEKRIEILEQNESERRFRELGQGIR